MRIWRLLATPLALGAALLSAESTEGPGTQPLGPARAVRGASAPAAELRAVAPLLPRLRRAAALQVPPGAGHAGHAGRAGRAGRPAPEALSDAESTTRVPRAAPRPLEDAASPTEPVMFNGATTLDQNPNVFGGLGNTALESDLNLDTILKQLQQIQDNSPKNIVILGTRQCSYLHMQIVELLAYALVLSNNHLWTSGGTGTHAAAIRGALRAESPDLLTVILPQTRQKQPNEVRELLAKVQNVIELGHDMLPLDSAARMCNTELLLRGDQLIVIAFHDSNTLLNTIEEAKQMGLLTAALFLD